MLTLEEKIQNLETIIDQKNFSPEQEQTLLKEIKRLKQELAKQEGSKNNTCNKKTLIKNHYERSDNH